jgi:hypothetical protein
MAPVSMMDISAASDHDNVATEKPKLEQMMIGLRTNKPIRDRYDNGLRDFATSLTFEDATAI